MTGQKEAWDSFYRMNDRPWRGVSEIRDMDFPAGSMVLEIGCGNGKTSAALRRMDLKVISMDFSEAAIGMCRENDPDGDYVCADVTDLPFENDHFDGAFAFHVLEHLTPEEMQLAVNEIRRVLKDGSAFYVKAFSTDDMRSMKGTKVDDTTVIRGNGIRYHYFTEQTLIDALKDMECVSIVIVNEPTRFGTVRSRLESKFIIHK